MSQCITSHPRYRFLKWAAFWKLFNVRHSRGFWWPQVPVMIAIALMMKAVSDNALSDNLLYLSMILYFFELPLLIARTRRAFRQTISAIGVSDVHIHHVSEGLKIAKYDYEITDDMRYGDFIVCNLIGELARVDHK